MPFRATAFSMGLIMWSRCPLRLPRRPFLVVLAVGIGVALSAVLPANAIDTGEFRRITRHEVLEPAGERTKLGTPVLALNARAPFQVYRDDSERSGRIGNPALSLQDASIVGRSRFFQWTDPATRTLTILAPRDEATVAAGFLRARGTANANGGRVHMVVHGVRAVVERGTFTAGVRVTPNPMIVGAVATTARGATTRHQSGLTGSETVESGLRLHPTVEYDMGGTVRRFSLLPAGAFKTRPDSDGGDETPAPGTGGLRSASLRDASHSPPATAGTTQAATMTLVLAPVNLDGRRSATEPGKPEKRGQADAQGARSALVINTGLDSQAEPSTLMQRELLAPVTPDVQSLLLGRSREGEVGDNFRKMRPGSEYSFGMLFILDSEGLWRVRWF